MKRLSIYEIRDKALDSGKAVCSVQQMSNLIGEPKDSAAVHMSRLVARGLVYGLMREKISFVDSDHVTAFQTPGTDCFCCPA